MDTNLTLFWFRRDLRLHDNAGLYHALKNNQSVMPIFIFDTTILNKLPKSDKRVLFIYQVLHRMKQDLQEKGSDLNVYFGDPIVVIKEIFEKNKFKNIYANHDYEAEALNRDSQIEKWAFSKNIDFKTFKDQCIFEKSEVVSDMKKPYSVFTPYKKKWLAQVKPFFLKAYPNEKYEANFLKVSHKSDMPSLQSLGFDDSEFEFPKKSVSKNILIDYAEKRDFPALDNTSKLGLHLRFGTVSIRTAAREALKLSDVWLSELIWRDFFMQILWHYPHVQKESFRPQYEKVAWRKESLEFKKWCDGNTGYPLVDAGMRELNTTGHMHNRVRMVVASFLTKHLLMHWSLGERYFAEKLLDYDLAANNGNWQWAAGTGCDAAPYFRVFNPETQMERFDPELKYVKKWVPEFGTTKYVSPMVEHKFARDRALSAFKLALKGSEE
ncbi:MAG: deoxyribodipyrimidine photo-lyase [Bdellovibrio sp.]|nr:deoxyribodipyrimidine photo-lyase [Bdellovibrio sp.]